LNPQLAALIVPLAVLGGALLLCLILRSVVLKILDRRITDRLTFLHVLLEAIRLPSLLWCIAAALAIAIQYAPAGPRAVYWSTKGIGAFIIISVTLVTAAILVRTMSAYGERHNMPFAVAGLSRTITNVFVFSIGLSMLLRVVFDITLTPVLTALGVGGLAVALALQDTLANFFAGVHILIEQPIAVGDFMKLSSGEEGVVKDIGWRTTRIHSGGNNITVIPNTKITSGILTNYSLPERRVSVDIPILAGYTADHNLIAEIALDVAHKTEGVLEDPHPSVAFDPGVTVTHLQMKLTVHVASHQDGGAVQSAIRRRLLERFHEADIPMPSPERRP